MVLANVANELQIKGLLTKVPLLQRRCLSLKKKPFLGNCEANLGGTQSGRSVGVCCGRGWECKLSAVDARQEEQRKEATSSEEGGQRQAGGGIRREWEVKL